MLPRLPQDPCYHDFADQRGVWGIPHFWNVVSNLPLVIVGAIGLWVLRRPLRAPTSVATTSNPNPSAS